MTTVSPCAHSFVWTVTLHLHLLNPPKRNTRKLVQSSGTRYFNRATFPGWRIRRSQKDWTKAKKKCKIVSEGSKGISACECISRFLTKFPERCRRIYVYVCICVQVAHEYFMKVSPLAKGIWKKRRATCVLVPEETKWAYVTDNKWGFRFDSSSRFSLLNKRCGDVEKIGCTRANKQSEEDLSNSKSNGASNSYNRFLRSDKNDSSKIKDSTSLAFYFWYLYIENIPKASIYWK